jgi:predicted ester cyclase
VKLDASDIDDLRPLIDAAVRSTVEQIRAAESRLADRLGFPEREAAALFGIPGHVGKRMIYSRAELVRFLEGGQ